MRLNTKIMKRIFLLLAILCSLFTNAQIVGLYTGESSDEMPAGSYLKDINNDFDKFHGTWLWTDGYKSVTFKLRKVVHALNPISGAYEDYMIGDYLVTTEYGFNTVVNTINLLDINPDIHPMYCRAPDNSQKIDFIFTDVVLKKESCRAIFEFLPGSTTQMKLTLKNSEGYGIPTYGTSAPYNHDFTIPNEIVVIKQ